MAKVYVSSTIADLEPERQAVIDWLVAADHQPVHSYRPNSETVHESCLDDIDGCELYVLILGHRYGFQPEEANRNVLVAQGDEREALAAYRKGLAIREALAGHDPANTQWQCDVAVACSKLGTLALSQDEAVRREYLLRGRSILAKLKQEGRLLPSQDWIAWFDLELAKLPKNKKPRRSKSSKRQPK